MQAYCLDRRITGSDQHLLRDSDGLHYVDEVPASVWYLSGKQKLTGRCLDTALALEGRTVETDPTSAHVTVMQSLLTDSIAWPPPWQKVMPARTHSAFIEALVDRVDVAMAGLETRFYETTWVKQDPLFASLKPGHVDNAEQRQAVLENPVNHMIRSFASQEESGTLPPVLYGRTSTKTGRLTVKSGPQILTLNRSLRRILRARGPNRSLKYLDFSSCEMRVLLYEAGLRCDSPDMYSMIRDEHLPDVERDVVKGAVIARTYGQNKHFWGKKLNVTGKRLDKIDEVLGNIIDTRPLLKRLKAEFLKNGYIRNRYGRRIEVDSPVDHVFINLYAQSSGMDVAMLGFATIMKILAPHDVDANFIIHDALVIDVPDAASELVHNIKTVKVDGFVQSYYLKIEQMGA